MHEFSVAQSIVDTILDQAITSNAKQVTEIDLDVGELMQLDVRALNYSLKLLIQVPVLRDAKLRTHVTRASFSCRKCGYHWNMRQAKKQLAKVPDKLLVREPRSKELPLHFLPYLYSTFLKCPQCGSSDFEVTKGKDIQLASIRMN